MTSSNAMPVVNAAVRGFDMKIFPGGNFILTNAGGSYPMWAGKPWIPEPEE